jgi:O6-methylguanine-DNA--protein-cysteine methyltransferase
MRKLQVKIPSKIGPLYLVGSANGTLGGYAGGLSIKKILLALEKKK